MAGLPVVRDLFGSVRGNLKWNVVSDCKEIWTRFDSGIGILSGHTSSASSTSNATYLEGKEKALALQELYRENDVALPPSCDLALHISDGIALSDLWLMGKHRTVKAERFYKAVYQDKIADVFECLDGHKDRRDFLRKLTSGSLANGACLNGH